MSEFLIPVSIEGEFHHTADCHLKRGTFCNCGLNLRLYREVIRLREIVAKHEAAEVMLDRITRHKFDALPPALRMSALSSRLDEKRREREEINE